MYIYLLSCSKLYPFNYLKTNLFPRMSRGPCYKRLSLYSWFQKGRYRLRNVRIKFLALKRVIVYYLFLDCSFFFWFFCYYPPFVMILYYIVLTNCLWSNHQEYLWKKRIEFVYFYVNNHESWNSCQPILDVRSY